MIFVFAIITLWSIRNHFIKLKQRKTIAEKQQKIVELELETQKNNQIILEQILNEQEAATKLNQEILKNEIEHRNRKLTAKALEFSTRNQMLEFIINELSTDSEFSNHSKLQNIILQLKNHLKSTKDFNDFFRHFEEVNPNFIKNIKSKHPTLTANDVRFLSYLYMNLSTKEISTLLNITIEACRKRKERISNKMELPDKSDLYSYLSMF